jgi:hypothetical protein
MLPDLPPQPTALIGRGAVLAQAAALVQGGTRLLTLLGPGGGGKLNDGVAPGCRGHLLMADIDQPWYLPDSDSAASQLIRMDDLWSVVFHQ